LFKKAEEILELANAIVGAAPDGITEADAAEAEFKNRMLADAKQDMLRHALMIPGKISGAVHMDLYDLQMESACFIRHSCRELVLSLRAMEAVGHVEEEHFNLLRKAVEEFRPLFAEWVATFQDSSYLWDDWGLFNPPGAMPDNDL
jgi:hypothetical protein